MVECVIVLEASATSEIEWGGLVKRGEAGGDETATTKGGDACGVVVDDVVGELALQLLEDVIVVGEVLV